MYSEWYRVCDFVELLVVEVYVMLTMVVWMCFRFVFIFESSLNICIIKQG